MNKFRFFLSLFFLVLGLITGFLTFSLSDNDSLGFTSGIRPGEVFTTGIDSSNDGVAAGLGFISGFSFLSSVLLINSITKWKE